MDLYVHMCLILGLLGFLGYFVQRNIVLYTKMKWLMMYKHPVFELKYRYPDEILLQ